jgi:ABC-type tungstate transport system substrate-binding protein
MKKLLSDTGFLTWIAIMVSPLLFDVVSGMLPVRITAGLLGLYVGAVFAFFILSKNHRTVKTIRVRLSLGQLLVLTLGLGLELGVIIAFMRSRNSDWAILLFLTLIAVPTVTAVAMTLLSWSEIQNTEGTR